MQSGPGKAKTQPAQDKTETEVRAPAKIDLKSVLVGLSSSKSKAAPPSAKTPVNDVTSSANPTETSASSKSQAPPPTKITSLSALITTTSSSSSSSSSSTITTTTACTTITTSTSTATAPAAATAAAETSVSSLSASGESKKESQNAGDGESKSEEQEEPFVMTPAYERLARLLARKRENAAAAAATVASGSEEGAGEVDSEALPQQSHWSKLRTTVQIASVVKQRSKRRHNHHRQDSFLRKFSTRHNSNLDADSDSEDNEAVTQEIEKEVEQKRLYRYVISPEGTFMMYWLLILTLAVLYNLWTCIAREAFREIQLEYTSFWISFDVICDLIYLADVAVQFRTGYLEQGLLVYDSKKLSKNYMASADFKLDVICLTPLDLIQLAIGWHPILRFPRFLKIYRTFRCVYMLESRTPYPNLFRVANLTHILFLGAHWFAAFFYLISEAENFVGAWTYPKPVGEFAGVTRKYLYSLFWSTLTLTTIGDLPQPTTNWE